MPPPAIYFIAYDVGRLFLCSTAGSLSLKQNTNNGVFFFCR